MIAIRKNMLNIIIIKHQTDLICHPNSIYLDIKEIDK